MTKILGIDPGKTTGWALIEVDENAARRTIKLIGLGSTKDMELVEIREVVQQADRVVYENWKTRPNDARRGAFNWNEHPAARVIGSLRTLFRLSGKDLQFLIVQEPVQKVPGYGLAGMKYHPGKKGMHQEDALAHATYYAVRALQAIPVRSA